MKTKIDEMKAKCFFIDSNDYICASEELIEEVLQNKSDVYINVSYTDYGGTFMHKCLIDYISENYPQNIIKELTSWNGENAFIFGDVAKDIKESLDNKSFPYWDNFCDYFTEREEEEKRKCANEYIQENDIIKEREKEVIYDFFFDNSNVCTFGVDYCETDITNALNDYRNENN